MEELNETMVVDNIENEEELGCESNHGVGGKVAIGAGLLAVAGAGVAVLVANKKGKLEEAKRVHAEKKAKKLEKKLEKCYTTMNQEGEIIESDEDEE